MSREAKTPKKDASNKAARGRSKAAAGQEREAQSAAAPSPFPPIADYAFLSDCHTGALVAPDGAIDWLCVPRFDSPSVFGTCSTGRPGTFRLGPFGINVPAARVYEPGTNVARDDVEDADRMDHGARRADHGAAPGEDEVTPHTRPPTDEDGDHMLVRTVLCLDGSVEVELICDPVFDYGRDARPSGRWSARTAIPPTRAAPGRPSASDRHGAGDRGRLDPCPPRPRAGRAALLLAVVGRGPGLAAERRRGERAARRDDAVLAGLAGSARLPTIAGAIRSSARRWRSRA